MITQSPNTSANPLIDTLRQAMEQLKDGCEWLIVAHDDDRLVGSLNAGLSPEQTVILEIPQDDWDFRDGELVEAIEWAIQQNSLKHLAVVGHSSAELSGHAETTGTSSSLEAESVEGGDRGYMRLRAGVTRTATRTRDAQVRFAQQIEQLFENSSVRNRFLDGDLAVYGLFFIAESSAFLAYDPDRKSFSPLMP